MKIISMESKPLDDVKISRFPYERTGWFENALKTAGETTASVITVEGTRNEAAGLGEAWRRAVRRHTNGAFKGATRLIERSDTAFTIALWLERKQAKGILTTEGE